MKCWLFVLKQFIEDLKESIKAVIVCVQIIPIIFDQILLLTSLVSKCQLYVQNSYILSYFF